MAAQFPGENNGGGGGSENLQVGMNPAEITAMASWAARFVAVAKESMLATLREQFPPPLPPPLTAAMSGRSSTLRQAPTAEPNQIMSGAVTRVILREVKKCELCNVVCTSPVMFAEHENGKRHQKKVRKLQKLEAVANNVGSDHPRTITVTIEQPAEAAAKRSQIGNKKKGGKSAIKPEYDGGDGEMEASKKQKTEENRTEMPFKCFMCDIKCINKTAFDKHLCGKKHKSKVRSHWAKERPFLGLQAVYPQQIAGSSASSNLNWW